LTVSTFRSGRGLALRVLIGLVLACLASSLAADHFDHALLARADQLKATDLPGLEKRASKGDAEASILLGEVYHRGRIVVRDDAVATGWFTLAAETGVPLAQFWLARKHDLGDALSRDQAVAATWYRRAAEQGYANAQDRLGELYARGLGVDQDFAAALLWFKRAAAQHHSAAMTNLILGNMALHGLGTERSLVQAYQWYDLASHGYGDDERTAELAESMLDRLGPHMTTTQIDDALTAATLWSNDLGTPHDHTPR